MTTRYLVCAAMVLLWAASPAQAQERWVRYMAIPSTVFHHGAPVERVGGDVVRAKLMRDFREPRAYFNAAFSSSIEAIEYNCRDRTARTAELTLYAGRMGGGAIVARERYDRPWRSIPPRTPQGVLLGIACGK